MHPVEYYASLFHMRLQSELKEPWQLVSLRPTPWEHELAVHASEAKLAREIVCECVPGFYGMRVIPYRTKSTQPN